MFEGLWLLAVWFLMPAIFMVIWGVYQGIRADSIKLVSQVLLGSIAMSGFTGIPWVLGTGAVVLGVSSLLEAFGLNPQAVQIGALTALGVCTAIAAPFGWRWMNKEFGTYTRTRRF